MTREEAWETLTDALLQKWMGRTTRLDEGKAAIAFLRTEMERLEGARDAHHKRASDNAAKANAADVRIHELEAALRNARATVHVLHDKPRGELTIGPLQSCEYGICIDLRAALPDSEGPE